MNPTGDFSRFQNDILTRYLDYDEITFGILIVDPRQSESREYILNYLDVFHNESGKSFDFFIPGYTFHYIEEFYKSPNFKCENTNEFIIDIGNIEFLFDKNTFNKFCNELNKNFKIRYTFNPMLILMSMKPGYIGTAKYIIIELDKNDYHTARRSGEFFMDLFNSIRTDNSLEHIQYHMEKTYIKGNLLDSIINSIGINWLTEIHNTNESMKKYRIKN